MDLSSIIALAGVVIPAVMGSTFLTTFVQEWFKSRKTTADASKVEADANKVEADAAVDMVGALLQWQGTLTARIEALEKSNAEYAAMIVDLNKKISHLEAQNVILSGTPK